MTTRETEAGRKIKRGDSWQQKRRTLEEKDKQSPRAPPPSSLACLLACSVGRPARPSVARLSVRSSLNRNSIFSLDQSRGMFHFVSSLHAALRGRVWSVGPSHFLHVPFPAKSTLPSSTQLWRFPFTELLPCAASNAAPPQP